ncbi:MAG: alpha/beta hydrolase [Bacillales bacterium]|nr:alpha/beta hydrolase [Bacillales bacterium]
MEIWQIILIIVFSIIILSFIIMITMTLPIAKKVFKDNLVRDSKEKWGRSCSAPDNEEQVTMFNRGIKWANENKDKITDLHMVNDGLNLYAQYFDFGSDKCVIISQGRTESLLYSYYFAIPYAKLGYNILVMDIRAHGLSDGIYNAVGFQEYKDILKWSTILHDEYHIKEIILHGICIGAATSIYAITSKNCPPYINRIIVDGTYVHFAETFKRHMIVDHRPIFPVYYEVMLMQKFKAKTHPWIGPIHKVKDIKIPILFIYTKQDQFSLPKKAVILFNKCGSSNKKLVWFDKGAHSHVRINDEEKYDAEIASFLEENKNY